MSVRCLLLTMAVFFTVNCYAGIHKCVDEYEHILYTDGPCPTINQPDTQSGAETVKPAAPVQAKPRPVDLPVAEPVSELSLPVQTKPRKYPYFYQLSLDLKKFMKRVINALPIKYLAARHKRQGVLDTPQVKAAPKPVKKDYQCDGRTSCAQMSSCEEATYFFKNCLVEQMDEDGNGVPCEERVCPKSL